MEAARRRSHGGGQCGGPRLIRKMSLSLQTVACGAPWPSKLPAPGVPEPGVDATAIHGRLGARVALLQSPILPTARSAYILAQKLQKLSVDKPHTRGYVFCQRDALRHSGCSCRTDGNGVTVRTCWNANQQVGFREMLGKHARSHSPLLRMSTGAKHLHGDRPAYLSACKRLTRFRPPA